MREPEVLERARGLVLGAAYGDALGARYEGLHYKPRPERVRLGRGVLFWRSPGWWTDDTDMSLGVLLSIAESGPASTEETRSAILRQWLTWYSRASRIDMGVWTSRVLRRVSRIDNPTAAEARTVAFWLKRRAHQGGGNGTVMRSGAVALGNIGDPQGCYDAAVAVAAITHPNEVAGQAAGIWAVLCERAMATGKLDLGAALAVAPPEWGQRFSTATPCGSNGRSGWAVATVLDAWWCVTEAQREHKSSSCLDLAARLAVSASSDPDTTASVACALAGSLYGAGAVPETALARIYGGKWTGRVWRAGDLEALVQKIIHRDSEVVG